jgi:ABC-2 type transport system ATP-binding protein
MSTMLSVQNLSKRFGPITAVDDVSFAIDRGEVLGFLGPNGAGKSTTMKIITGFLPPSNGSAEVCGFDVVTHPIEVKKRIGYLPEGAPVYGDMTPARLLEFVAEIRGVAERSEKIARAVARTNLEEVLHQPIETLSKGFKRRVGLAQAILHDPPVLILDEPTDGLDPNQKHEVRTLIKDMAGDKAIIISTHILEEVDAVCTRAVIIARGRIVVDATPAELRQRSAYHNAVVIRVASTQASQLSAALNDVPGVARVDTEDFANGAADLMVVPEDGREITSGVRDRLRESGIDVEQMRVEQGRLDDVFRQITTAG